ncbi:MAG: D-glycerate dehydrogenase [Gemmatimonadales bacterium]|nr:D-glycerate dehydrogenase [Gemmatimonadales bacterium]NIN13046.1 D-glycerate dehydrogenase [Gemmatimonadales bacterium]NIN51130.1 D-glycerate dehydrogenase [Gemmatimonadales bacterium]NIP08594.1 D-glycerate dehydrogenase [Gemmatimonadales bacterium]NIQ99704.1 D-glycerate dehydrogenase [Gemmatimonadales bacterium]
MPADILIAAELRELLPDTPVPAHTVEWLPAEAPTPAGPYVAIVPLLSRRIAEPELDALPQLKVVANCAVGVDNVDLDAANRRGIIVTNTPEVLTEATADLTWALILAVARRLKEGQVLVAEGGWTGWHPTQLLGLELNGSTLGIVGAGRIGQAVARRAAAFAMRILYADVSARPELEAETGARRVSLTQLLEESDVVTLHTPSTAETRGMFDHECFNRMRAGSIFINTARGDLVDEAALLAALDAGKLAGVGLDVFPQEPSVHPALVAHPRVVTLPHIGSATTHTRHAMANLAVRNVRAVLAGEPPLTPVLR